MLIQGLNANKYLTLSLFNQTKLSGKSCPVKCLYCVDKLTNNNMPDSAICKLCEYGYFMVYTDFSVVSCIQCSFYSEFETTENLRCIECYK